MGRNNCTQTLTTVDCNTNTTDQNLVQMGPTSDSSLALWSLSPITSPPAPFTQLLADGNYYIQSVGRQACENYTSISDACGGTNNVAMTAFSGTGLQVWTFMHLGGNLYDVTCSARSQCASYLSTPSCGQNFVDVFFQVCHYSIVFTITATTQVRMASS